MYGAVAGLTDGGFDGESFGDVFLAANGTVNWNQRSCSDIKASMK